MAGLELTAALARLLSDGALRRRFAADPQGVAAELPLEPDAAAALLAIDLAGLEAQARVLCDKRRGAVARLVPRTWRLLGPEATAHFAAYAAAAEWPAGHLRHQLDAQAFLHWLAGRGLPCARLELVRLDTRLGSQERRLALVPGARRWQLPALYLAWRGRSGWREWLVTLGRLEQP